MAAEKVTAGMSLETLEEMERLWNGPHIMDAEADQEIIDTMEQCERLNFLFDQNAEFFFAMARACFSINDKNPQVVAAEMPNLVKAARAFLSAALSGDDTRLLIRMTGGGVAAQENAIKRADGIDEAADELRSILSRLKDNGGVMKPNQMPTWRDHELAQERWWGLKVNGEIESVQFDTFDNAKANFDISGVVQGLDLPIKIEIVPVNVTEPGDTQ